MRLKRLVAACFPSAGALREIGGTLFATVAVLAGGAAQSVVIARELGPYGKGVISLIILLPAVATPLVASGFAASATYFASRAEPIRLLRNASTFAVYASAVAVLAILALAAVDVLDNVFPDVETGYLSVSVALVPVMILQNVYAGLLMGLGRLPVINALRTCAALSSFAVVASAAAAFSDDTAILVIAGGLASVLFGTAVAQTVLLRRMVGPIELGWDRPLLRQQAAYAARDHPGAVLSYLNYRLDQLFVSAYVGASGVGVYSVAVTLGEILWLAPDALSTVIFPRSSRKEFGDSRRSAVAAAGVSMCIAAIGALILWIAGQKLIEAVFSSAFRSSYEALRWLLPGAIFLGPAKILAADLAGRGYPAVNSLCAGGGLVVTATLDIVLIPREGIIGAAKASSAAYLFVALCVALAFASLGTKVSSSGRSSLHDQPVSEEGASSLEPPRKDSVRDFT